MGGAKEDSHLSLAKITRPVFTDILLRNRLFKDLDIARKKSVIWISGPGGSGKTTLISSYVDDRDLQCLWYQMDEGDADPTTFFFHLGHAARQINKRKKRPMPLLTPEYMMGGVPVFSRRFFAETFSRLKRPSLVVFDNYQEVLSEAPIHDIMKEGVANAPKDVSVVIMSREHPPSEFSRIRASDKMVHIDWHILRLSSKETEGIVKLRGQHVKVAKALHEKTDGWVAGLILMLEGGAKEDVMAGSLDALHTYEIFDYFAGEVFRKTDNESRMFLMKTSFLPHMTSDMTEAVMGTDHGKRKLSDLSRRNLFVMRKSGSAATYQYHPLFRHFLKNQAERELNEDQVREVQKRSAAILAEKGLVEEAARLLIETEQWEDLAGLVMGNAQSLLRQGRFGVLDEWMRALPNDMLEGNPWLRFFSGAAIFPRDPSASKALFEQAFHRFQDIGDAAGAFLSWSGSIEAIAFRAEGVGELDGWIPRHSDLVKRFGDVLPEELKNRVVASMYTALVLRMPDHPDFEKWKTEALRIIYGTSDIDLKVKLLFHHSLYLQDSGKFDEAESLLNIFRSVVINEEMMPLASLFFRLSLIHQSNFTARHEECIANVEQGLELARNSGVHVLDSLMAGHAAWNCLKRGDLANVRCHLSFLESTPSFHTGFSQGFYAFLKAFESLESGELHRAATFSERNLTICRQAGYLGTMIPALLMRAHIAYELGDFERVQHLLDEVSEFSRRLGEPYISYKFDILITKAYFAIKDHNTNAGYEFLRDALGLGKRKSYFQSYLWRPRVIVDLCMKALEAGIEPDYVRALISRNRLIPESAPVHLEEWPWPIKIYTFGRFGILRDDKPVKTEGRSQKKPMEMLKAIIALGGRQVREESIADVLWPEAAGDAAHNAFTTTMSRLRKILGIERAIEVSEGRVTLMPNVCWVDIWAFERLIGEADRAWKHGENDRGRMMSERSFAMYSGAFLSGEDDHWNISAREKLKSKFLRNVINLGTHLEENDLWNDALEHYMRGLEVDELMEEFYKRAMVCCIKLDRKAEAGSIYNRCAETLGRVLGIQPSRETKELLIKIQG